MKYFVVFSFILFSVTGCGSVTGQSGYNGDSSALIKTSKDEYSATVKDGTVEVDIPHRFTNQRDNTVYIVNCNGSFAAKMQKRIANNWIDAVDLIIPLCLSPAIEVPAGESYNHIFQISAGLSSGEVYPRFEVEEIRGTYRIVWIDVLKSFDPDTHPFGEQIPLEQRVSNTFKIR